MDDRYSVGTCYSSDKNINPSEMFGGVWEYQGQYEVDGNTYYLFKRVS